MHATIYLYMYIPDININININRPYRRQSDDRSVLETGDLGDVWEWMNRWSRLAIYLRQVIPNFIAVFIENFTYFLMLVFAAYMGDRSIVAHNINAIVLSVFSTITYGMGEATSIRIGTCNICSAQSVKFFYKEAYCTCIIYIFFVFKSYLISD